LSAVEELGRSIEVAEERLAQAIQRLLGRYTGLVAPEDTAERSNPYKSLDDYKLEDAPYFYGRDEAIAEMLALLERGGLTVLESDSGSGKSSLMQAGLASRLLAGGDFPLYIRAYNAPPDEAIKKAFLPDYQKQPELQRFRDMSLRGFLEIVTGFLGERQVVVFLDQFEEFFSELRAEEQETFAEQLRECVQPGCGTAPGIRCWSLRGIEGRSPRPLSVPTARGS
jgi:hypothetical protein